VITLFGGEAILSALQVDLSIPELLTKIKWLLTKESRGLMSLFDWFANRRKSGPISQERQEALPMGYG